MTLTQYFLESEKKEKSHQQLKVKSKVKSNKKQIDSVSVKVFFIFVAFITFERQVGCSDVPITLCIEPPRNTLNITLGL